MPANGNRLLFILASRDQQSLAQLAQASSLNPAVTGIELQRLIDWGFVIASDGADDVVVYRLQSKDLEVHSKIEEEIFYPAVREKADREGQELVREGYKEHHVVDVLMIELRAMDTQAENFDAKFTVLIENVEHHIEEEEGEMLPDAEKLLRDELETLGEQMQGRKQELMATTA